MNRMCLRQQRLVSKPDVQFNYDSERVKSVEGVELLRTQLVLEIETEANVDHNASPLAADIELVPESEDSDIQRLQLVILESLVIRRDISADATQGSTQTNLEVTEGQTIAPNAVVARTQILCKEGGVVRGVQKGAEAVRRCLVLRNSDVMTINTNSEPKVTKGDLVVEGSNLASGVFASESGQVISISNNSKDSNTSGSAIVPSGYNVVDDGGDTTMLPGELVELRQIEQVNEAMAITGGARAQYTPMLLGITKASKTVKSAGF
jgi:DNA-directed RNA polymerase subunit beta'